MVPLYSSFYFNFMVNFKDWIQLYQGCRAAMWRQFTLNRWVSRKPWYSLDQPRMNEKPS